MFLSKGLKMGIDFTHFGLQSSMVLQKFMGMYESIYWFNSKQIKKKEKYGNLKIDLRIFFVCVLFIIWSLFFYLLEGRSEKNEIFWSEIGPGFGEPGST